MEENVRGEEQLNATQKSKEELEKAKQELYDIRERMQELDLPEGFEPVRISQYGEIKLSDQITEKDVIGIELENKEKEKRTLLYKQLEDDELMLIATINEEEEILLSEEYKEKYKGILPEEQLDSPYVQSQGERQKEAEIEVGKTERDSKATEQEKQQDTKSKTGKEFAIAMALGISENQILNVIEVKDENTMSNVINRDVQTKNLFIVKLRQDDGGLGSNDYVMMNQRADGTFEVASGTEMSDTFQDINQGLGIKNSMQQAEIKAGELSAVGEPYGNARQVEVNRYKFRDETTYILEVNRDYNAQMHVYREENGKLIPLCTEEHGKHDEEKIKLPNNRIRKVKEEEERTPWGDAEARRSRY